MVRIWYKRTGETAMSALMKNLGLDSLSVDERTILAHDLLESIEAESESSPISPAMMAELERRLEARKANPKPLIPWEKIYADTLERLAKRKAIAK